ncbi:MAG TPA: hypothetical protein DIT32_02195 [Peptococcaceae bacterium]|nr:hypothetical protein [Peptococcaceae bacterium]
MYKRYSTVNRLLIVLADILVIEMSYMITMTLRFGAVIPYENFRAYLNVSPWINLVSIIVFYIFDLYNNWTKRDLFPVMTRISIAVVINTFLVISIVYLTQNIPMPRSVVLGNVVVEIILMSLSRYVIWTYSQKRQQKKKIAIIGENDEALLALTCSFPELRQSRYSTAGNFVIKDSAALNDLLNTQEIDVVALKSQLARQTGILEACFNAHKEILIIPDILTILLKTAKLQILDDKMLFNLNHFGVSPIKKNIKRVVDLCVAVPMSILLFPLMLVIAVLIKFTSPGPVFYQQERLGEGNRKFNIIKYRTMIHHAEDKTGPVMATGDDSRITKLGFYLREYRIDELPQLINVIRGDMSMVGPRPEREYFVDQYIETIPFYRYRMLMKPGITGLAQVMGKYTTTPQGKLQYDLMYISSYSLLLDFRILLETARAALHKENAIGADQKCSTGSEKKIL